MLTLVNRRKSERRLCRSFAKIQFATGGLPRDCMISDISDGGVKIIAEYPEIPTEFTVIFSEGRPRACKLASTRFAIVDLPAPESPVNHKIAGRWCLICARDALVTVTLWWWMLVARRRPNEIIPAATVALE